MAPQQHSTNRPPHLVYVARDAWTQEIRVYVHHLGDINQSHICDSYFPDHTDGVINRRHYYQSPIHKIEELGWTSNSLIFKHIVARQPVPQNQPTQTATFNAWKSALILTLNQHPRRRWTQNLGNYI